MKNLVKLHILNASGTLDSHIELIETAFDESLSLLPDGFITEGIDVTIQDLASWVVPELGVVGHTYSGHVVQISLDPKHDLQKIDLIKTIVHELHHAVRWQKVSFNKTLGELIVSEGLACLFEEELTGQAPIYVQGDVSDSNIEVVKSELNNSKYDQSKWFFGSTAEIPRWFGYTYGYSLCKAYAKQHDLTAAKMVDLKAETVLG